VRHFLFLSGIYIRFVLQVYYLDNLLCDVEVPVGTPRCKFYNAKIIEDITKLDRQVMNAGVVTFGQLNVSK